MGNFGFKNVSKRNNIDLMEYLCYGLGDFSFCFIYGAIGSYIVFFYTDVACISAATVGTVLLVSKIFDGISDMMMGYIIENVHSPLGKARQMCIRDRKRRKKRLLAMICCPGKQETLQRPEMEKDRR